MTLLALQYVDCLIKYLTSPLLSSPPLLCDDQLLKFEHAVQSLLNTCLVKVSFLDPTLPYTSYI